MNDGKTLELTLKGTVACESGKLLIIDPCYLRNQYHDEAGATYEAHLERSLELQRTELDIAIEQSALIGAIDPKMSDTELIATLRNTGPKMEELEQRLNAVKSDIEVFGREPRPNPPYLMQGNGYVIFQNGIGDGTYPVIRTDTGWKIVFNYHLKKDGTLDESKLEGTLLGSSAVDSGSQMIIDPTKANIKKNIGTHAYTLLNLKPGQYKCAFSDENKSLLIKNLTQ